MIKKSLIVCSQVFQFINLCFILLGSCLRSSFLPLYQRHSPAFSSIILIVFPQNSMVCNSPGSIFTRDINRSLVLFFHLDIQFS